jgi:hypothetical protein
MPDPTGSVVRVGEPGQPCFQIRPGEEGLSVFDPDAIQPPLEEDEILQSFRPSSIVVVRSVIAVQAAGLDIEPVPGAEALPPRLQQAHREIRPRAGMTRKQFKQALKGLE